MINLIGAYVIGVLAIALWRHPIPLGRWNQSLFDEGWGWQRALSLVLMGLIATSRLVPELLNGVFLLHVIPFVFSGLNVWLHEAGHGLLFWGPRTLKVAGGTLFELGLPVVCTLVWLRRGYFELIPLGVFWLGYNALSVGPYIADARAQALPLLGGNHNAMHDWNYMLAQAGLLEHDQALGAVVNGFGHLLIAIGLLGWLFPQALRRLNATS